MELSGAVYLVDNGAAGQAPVFSNEPGGDGYTPAWTVHKVTWMHGDATNVVWIKATPSPTWCRAHVALGLVAGSVYVAAVL